MARTLSSPFDRVPAFARASKRVIICCNLLQYGVDHAAKSGMFEGPHPALFRRCHEPVLCIRSRRDSLRLTFVIFPLPFVQPFQVEAQ